MLVASDTYAHKLKRWLFELPTIKLIVLAWVSSYVVALPPVLYANFVTSTQSFGGPDMGKHAIVKMIVFGCIVAPLIETTINQWACLRLLKRFRCATGIAIGISALIFGLGHYYSAAYVVMATLIGAILATVFVIEDTRNGHPFIATLAVHVLRNGATTLLVLFAR
ncbi:CPBP family intramembrane glutamic endopeptidase [Paraburkholderia sp. ZP32-5]|uniref:CPBP family intramembrane glutamic endopeptidase n=1 Tax=Paraburkholderia sp. ZP32-5 TaxID=2883245 RepID=UPI001F3C35E8|nr:CPBP family intramembrane glutamic endopeptidase [Paraburkholderia sp. ZP32-5]